MKRPSTQPLAPRLRLDVTDNGAIFTAESRHGRCAIENELPAMCVAYKHSRPCHPETCGRVERFRLTLKKHLTPIGHPSAGISDARWPAGAAGDNSGRKAAYGRPEDLGRRDGDQLPPKPIGSHGSVSADAYSCRLAEWSGPWIPRT